MSNGGIGSQNKGQATPYWPIRAFSPNGASQPALASTTTAPTNAGTYTITPSALVLANNVDTSNYVTVLYRSSTFTINKAIQDSLTLTSKLGSYNGGTSTMKLTTIGGSDTGTVTYAIVVGGTASGCSVSTNVLSYTSAGTCKVVATKAATSNYLVAYSDTVTITLSAFVSHQQTQTQSVPTQLPINGKNSLETTTLTVPVITGTGFSLRRIMLNGNFANTPFTEIYGSGFTGATSISVNFSNIQYFTVDSDTQISFEAAQVTTPGPMFIECSDGRMGPTPFYMFVP